jgi:hypothetical protein
MKVAQGNELAVDVVGMRLDDVVKRLRVRKVQKFVLPLRKWTVELKLFL